MSGLILFLLAAPVAWFVTELLTSLEEGESFSPLMLFRCAWFGLLWLPRSAEWLANGRRDKNHYSFPVNSMFWWNTPVEEPEVAPRDYPQLEWLGGWLKLSAILGLCMLLRPRQTGANFKRWLLG